MTTESFNADLLKYLDTSPTPFHATAEMCRQLQAAGFEGLSESDTWSVTEGGRYFVTRGDASLIAFCLPKIDVASNGFRMVGSHTDSPCLKLKPNAIYEAHGYTQLGVEVYGGVLLNPWFDRDLSIAGRVALRDKAGQLIYRLVDFRRPVAVIPSLAIHLDREANEKRKINQQTYLPAVLAVDIDEPDLEKIILQEIGVEEPSLLDMSLSAFDLSLYPTEPSNIIGLNNDFIASARLDNLLSCYVSLQALLSHPSSENSLIVCNDHEEVGSGSAIGARGTFLRSVIERLAGSHESFARCIANSLLISTDNAHGVHPNFADRHDKAHGPILNKGPAIKINANQAYASTSETAAIFRQACQVSDIPVQTFVSRADMACGSTIGPLTATALGVRTVDVGVPTFAMHSIRELAGSRDPHYLYRALGNIFT